MTHSYSLLLGATAVTLGMVGIVLFLGNRWPALRGGARPLPRARWLDALTAYVLLGLAGVLGRVAIRLGELARDDVQFSHQRLVSTVVGLVLFVSFWRLLWLLVARRRELGLRRRVSVPSVLILLLLGVTVQSMATSPPLGRADPVIYSFSAHLSPWSPQIGYHGVIQLGRSGEATAVEHFKILPPDVSVQGLTDLPGRLILSPDWRDQQKASGIRLTARPIVQSRGGGGAPDGLQVDRSGPVEVRIHALGWLRRSAHVEPSGLHTKREVTDPSAEEAEGGMTGENGSSRSATDPWPYSWTRTALLEVQVPGTPFLRSAPAGRLAPRHDWVSTRDPVSVEFRWPPRDQIFLRDPIRPRFEILYVPDVRFAWLRGPLRQASVHPTIVNVFSLLLWPLGLTAIWVARRDGQRSRSPGRATRVSNPALPDGSWDD